MKLDTTYFLNVKRNITEMPTYQCEMILQDGSKIIPSNCEQFTLLFDKDKELEAIEFYCRSNDCYENHIVDIGSIKHIVEKVDCEVMEMI